MAGQRRNNGQNSEQLRDVGTGEAARHAGRAAQKERRRCGVGA